MTPVDELVEVAVLRLPVPVWLRAQEQSDALLREFALIATDTRDAPEAHHVPRRLMQLVQELDSTYAGFTGPQEAQLADAAAQGLPELDLHYNVPREVAPAARRLGELLDEADRYCQEGQHLLTLAASEELVRFRWWFLDQFTEQVEGRPPVPWPDYTR